MSKREFFAQFKDTKQWDSTCHTLARIRRGKKEILVAAAALRDWLRVVGLDFDYEIGPAQTTSGMYSNMLTIRAGRNTARFYEQPVVMQKNIIILRHKRRRIPSVEAQILEIDLRGKL